MATPVIGTDGVDSVNAALVRKALTSNAKLDIKVLYFRAQYTGSAWAIVSSTDSSQIVSGNLTWSTNKLTIALSGYTAAPVVVVSQTSVATPYHVEAHATSSGNIDVTFWDMAGAQVTTQGTSMDFNAVIIGV